MTLFIIFYGFKYISRPGRIYPLRNHFVSDLIHDIVYELHK